MSTTDTERNVTIGRAAALRAAALRDQAAALGDEALQPLRAALSRRAGELELAAAVLAPQPVLAATA